MMKPETRSLLAGDGDFLFRLYASTRADEIASVGWPAAQQEAFLRMQFSMQQRWYETVYSDAEHKIIEVQGQPVGRMIVLRGQNEWQLIDISLIPEFRGSGIGSELLRAVIRECAEFGAVLKLQVLRTNPAMRLYKRLGFIATAEDQIYIQMELRPGSENSQ
jgi:ribosomal protein S18 acetylase RimI-like enzyme